MLPISRNTSINRPIKLGSEEIRSYQLFLLNQKRVKLSTYIQAVCALRFFYQNTLHRRIEIDRIPLPRYEKKLPVILSKAEVKALLEAPRNLKHRAMLATMYGAGLRVSEVAKPESVRSGSRTSGDLGSRRQRPQGQAGDAGGAAPRSARRVLAVEAAQPSGSFPARRPDCPIATDSVFKLCRGGRKKGRNHQAGSPALAAPRFRDASAGRRSEPARDPGSAGPRASQNHGTAICTSPIAPFAPRRVRWKAWTRSILSALPFRTKR